MLSSFPRLIAANHVLHRLLAPRHPPSALLSLTQIALRTDPEGPTRKIELVVLGELLSVAHGSRTIQLSKTGRRELGASPCKLGGADRDRTDDLRLAKPALSQLSYSPLQRMVGLGRFELPTSRLSGVRSNQLSYRPDLAPAPRAEVGAWWRRCTTLGLSKPNSTQTMETRP